MNSILRLQPHQDSWARNFDEESECIQEALGIALIAIYHIGSTSIKGIHAKPIIDILIETTSLDDLDQHSSGLDILGYESLGEFGISGRRYFRKNDASSSRTHQVHAFMHGSPHVTRHLAFRDYLRSHPDVALRYCVLKRSLFDRCNGDIEAYINGKDPFIKQTERDAVVWFKNAAQQGAPANP